MVLGRFRFGFVLRVRLDGWDFQPQFLFSQQRTDLLEPPRTAALSAQQPDRAERPQAPLPGDDVGGELGGILRLGRSPVGTQVVQEQRSVIGIEPRPEQAQVLGIQTPPRGHGGDRLASLGERLPFGQCRGEVLFQRQQSGVPEVSQSLVTLVRRAESLDRRVLPVERADFSEPLVCPIASAVPRREVDASRQQHRMPGDFVAGIEVFSQEGRRHHQRVAGVGEALARCPLGGKFPRRVKRHAGQVTDREGVLGVVQPSQYHWPRISRPSQRLGVQILIDPGPQRLPLCSRRLRRFLRRHFAVVEHLDHLQPRLRPLADRGKGRELLEIQLANLLLRRVAAQAIAAQQWPNRLLELGIEPCERHGILGKRSIRYRQIRHNQHGNNHCDDQSSAASANKPNGELHDTRSCLIRITLGNSGHRTSRPPSYRSVIAETSTNGQCLACRCCCCCRKLDRLTPPAPERRNPCRSTDENSWEAVSLPR